jgi:hypothetical protein
MNNPDGTSRRYEICFTSLFKAGHSLTFPCDARGGVDLDNLSERARANYLYARAMVGRDFSAPSVSPASTWLDSPMPLAAAGQALAA